VLEFKKCVTIPILLELTVYMCSIFVVSFQCITLILEVRGAGSCLTVAIQQHDGLEVEAIGQSDIKKMCAMILLYCPHLSDGSVENRPWLWWLRSLMIFLDFQRHLVL
jgi:hypothetical protein